MVPYLWDCPPLFMEKFPSVKGKTVWGKLPPIQECICDTSLRWKGIFPHSFWRKGKRKRPTLFPLLAFFLNQSFWGVFTGKYSGYKENGGWDWNWAVRQMGFIINNRRGTVTLITQQGLHSPLWWRDGTILYSILHSGGEMELFSTPSSTLAGR